MINRNAVGGLQPAAFNELLPYLPGVERISCDIDFFGFENPLDSSNLQPDDWVRLAETIGRHYDDYQGFVVLHGTDTMSFTASALSFMLENLSKPVILTGAMLPIDDVRSDGRENFITALEIASRSDTPLPEVAICFDSRLYRGNRTIKYSSAKFQAFVSPNYPVLAESGFLLEYYTKNWRTPPEEDFRVATRLDSGVSMIKFFPGISEAFVRAVLSVEGTRAVVLETYGNGNLPSFEWLIRLLDEAIRREILIVNVTQCTAGRVKQGEYATSTRLQEIGVLSGQDITTAGAITKLMYLFGKYPTNSQQVRNAMQQDLAGEISV